MPWLYWMLWLELRVLHKNVLYNIILKKFLSFLMLKTFFILQI